MSRSVDLCSVNYQSILKPAVTLFDVVTGVSAGAINTAAFSLFAPGDEEAAIKFLSDEWQNMGGRDIYKEWKKIGGIADGVLNEYGTFDTSPLT